MPDKFEKYKKYWDDKFKEYEEAREVKFKELSSLAEDLADYMYSNYNVDRVYLFGSLLDKNQFRSDSDIDLATIGLDLGLLYDVSSKLAVLSGANKVDLVVLENCADYIKNKIIKGGKLIARKKRY